MKLTTIENIYLSVLIDMEIKNCRDMQKYDWGSDQTFMERKYDDEIQTYKAIGKKLKLHLEED